MNQPFDIARWRPTEPPKSEETALTPDELEGLSTQLADETKDILHHPYDPKTWLNRAETLRKLRYPELALGDAHKASLLCRQHLRKLAEDDALGRWRLGSGMAFWMLATQPDDSDLEQRLLVLHKHARRAEERDLKGSKIDGEGTFYPQPYPWLSLERSRRSDGLRTLLNHEFNTSAIAVGSSHPFCLVKQYAFGKGNPASKDIFGIFATQDIPAHKIILVDTTRIHGCCGPGAGGDTANLGGALACGDPIHPNLPDEDIDLDLRWVRDETGIGATSSLLTIRLLLAAVQDEVQHPLDHPLVARLTPNYPDPKEEGVEPESFHVLEDIDVLLRALRQFGLDIFARLEFDTWVLFTISQRQYNNVCGDSISGSLMPLFSFFNHSCEPNVGWSRFRETRDSDSDKREGGPDDVGGKMDDSCPEMCSIDHGTVTVTTTRDIQKGEQLFVEYDGVEHLKSVDERRRRLTRWLRGDCMCSRCVREAAKESEELNGVMGKQSAVESTANGKACDDGEKVQFR